MLYRFQQALTSVLFVFLLLGFKICINAFYPLLTIVKLHVSFNRKRYHLVLVLQISLLSYYYCFRTQLTSVLPSCDRYRPFCDLKPEVVHVIKASCRLFSYQTFHKVAETFGAQGNMVDSVVLVVVKSVAGWLFNKGKKRAMEKLKNSSDVVDQALCSWIASDLDDIKSEMRAAKRKNLVASINSYNEGLTSICFDVEVDGPPQKKPRMDPGIGDRAMLEPRVELETYFKGNFKLSSTTKERFANARIRAGDALGNQNLETMDKILAYYLKVMATLLEDVNTADPSRALLLCKDYLKQLNSMKAISDIFNTEISGLPQWKERLMPGTPGKTQRLNIIWSVCHVNRVVFDIAQLFGGERVFRETFIWPCIEIRGNEWKEVDPLRDQRLIEVLRSAGKEDSKEDCSVIQSFGLEGLKLTLPFGIAANPQGQFLVVDDRKTDVFDNYGNYLYPLHLPTDNTFQYRAVDIDTDRDGNAYLLVAKGINKLHFYEVFVFDNSGKLYHNFPLRNNSKGRRLAVTRHGDNTEVLVLAGEEGLHAMVEVYDTDGKFICQFGERILQDAQDIVGANDGSILVLDKCHEV